MRKHGWMLWAAVALALTLSAGGGGCACKGGSKGKGTTQNNGNGQTNQPPVSECDKHKDKVEKLYRAAITESDAKKRSAAEAAVPDNVDMILNDCRTDPKRFGPCLARVNTVAEMEKTCIIPLDDAGKVEGRAFGGR